MHCMEYKGQDAFPFVGHHLIKALYNGLVLRAFRSEYTRTDDPVALTNRLQNSANISEKLTSSRTFSPNKPKNIIQHCENAAQHCSRHLAGWTSPGRRHSETEHRYCCRTHSHQLCRINDLLLRADHLDRLLLCAHDLGCADTSAVKQRSSATEEQQRAELPGERWRQPDQRHASGTHQ